MPVNDDPELAGRRARSLTGGALALLALLGLTALLAHRIQTLGVAAATTADVRQELPAQVGEWQGEDIFYCQNEQCMRSFLASELNVPRACLACGGRLDKVALGERNLLPADTIIARKSYRNAGGESLSVTIVLSGSEQRSIHRPQQCLPAQGFAIERSSVLSAPLEGRPPLKLMVIRARSEKVSPARLPTRVLLAYWFAGGGHETHDHFQRLAFMALDNLIHGIRPRWAYVSLQTSSDTDGHLAEQRIAEFLRQLYPFLKPAPPSAQ
ncbi:MAG: exosortase C-terminal domain/associated protein EpsI [bacterium]